MTVAANVLKQVEFYFSNSNLPTDKFLKQQTELDDGWVSIELIASFAKMKKLTEDLAVIVEALKTSPTLLEVNAEGTKVRRKEPLPEHVDINPQSIYAKGFPKEHSLEEVTEFFTKHLKDEEKIASTRLRRFRGGKDFKGSVFIEFDSAETATRIVSLELKAPTPEEQPLEMHMKADYLAKKAKEYEERKAKGKKRGRDEKTEEGGDDQKKEEFKRDIPEDCLIKVEDLPAECMREDIKALFVDAGCQVSFVEFNKGNVVGYVRLAPKSELKATAVVAKLVEKKTLLKDKQPQLVVLEGEEEKTYWNKVFEGQLAKKKAGGGGKKGGKHGYRGGKRQRSQE